MARMLMESWAVYLGFLALRFGAGSSSLAASGNAAQVVVYQAVCLSSRSACRLAGTR